MRQSIFAVVVICLNAILLGGCDSSSREAERIDAKSRTDALEVTVPTELTPDDLIDTDLNHNAVNTARPLLHWAKPGLAPLFIANGSDQGRGMGDQMFVQVQELMPRYDHVNLSLNYPRLLEELRKGSNVCGILHYTPERARYMVYSRAVVVTPSYQLYVSAKALARFKEKTGWAGAPASFDQLMSMSDGLKMAVTPGQSYGAGRDEILNRHVDKVELIRSFADQEALVKMLAANRVDMVLGFPWVINYRAEQLDVRSDLVKIPLNDVAQYEASYIACADTPLGRDVVKAIDEISPPVHDRSKSFLPRWLTAKESQLYYGVYHEYFFEAKPLP
mgnify:CR=1 FL=1